MSTNCETVASLPRRRRSQPHRLGMGWHYVWQFDPPIEHHEVRADGTAYYWLDRGETSEGCIMWLADLFATRVLGTTARNIYREAYRQSDGDDLDDEWLTSDELRDAWGPYTILPERWTAENVRKLFEDIEDVNYHSFNTRMAELIEQHIPDLADRLADWCRPVTCPLANHI